jgi:hypothetical protein
LALLAEGSIERVLAETIDKLDEVLIQQIKVLSRGELESTEGLLNELLFCVLSCQREDVNDHAPP